jgi:hypothetical protein
MSKFFIRMVIFYFHKICNFFLWQRQQISHVQIPRVWNAYK